MYFFDTVENIVGKGENAGYQHFLPFPLCFPKDFSQGCETSGLFVNDSKEKNLGHVLYTYSLSLSLSVCLSVCLSLPSLSPLLSLSLSFSLIVWLRVNRI